MKRFFSSDKYRKRGIHKSKRTYQERFAEWLYPSSGIVAWSKYLILSLKRKNLSSHKIALGFAVGAMVSFTPFLGLHGLLSITIAYLLNASMMTSLIGTLVGNPWTFPLIWAWSLSFGNFILGRSSEHYSTISVNFNISNFFENTSLYWDIYILPMTTGGVPSGILVGLVLYFMLKYQIDKFRSIRKKILKRRNIERRSLKMKLFRDGLAVLKRKRK